MDQKLNKILRSRIGNDLDDTEPNEPKVATFGYLENLTRFALS